MESGGATIELPRVGDPGSGLGDAWRVIVLNDDHNTFEGVAFALASVIPGVTYDGGMQLAKRLHNTRQAVVLVGHRAPAPP